MGGQMKKRILLLFLLIFAAGCSKAAEEQEPNPTETVSPALNPAEGEADKKEPETASLPFGAVKIDGMEYAVSNPASYSERPVFLRRAEGDATWEEVVVKIDGKPLGVQLENFYLAFSSKEEGMLVFGSAPTTVLVTEDGGTTWKKKDNIPEPGESEHQMVLCLAAAGQHRFVMGYRYWGTDGQEGNIFLTKDGAETWQQVKIPIPEPAGMTLAYIEPITFLQEGESLVLELCYRGDDVKGQRMEGKYKAASKDGGETWELAEQGEISLTPFE